MPNINDYLDWRGDIPIKKMPLNEVDNMILSRFSYFPFHKIKINKEETIESLMEKLKDFKVEKFNIAGDKSLSEKLLKSDRFRKLKVTDFYANTDNEAEKQFSAITIHLPFNEVYVSYCGTDNTLVGWKEDFNLSFMQHIPAQIEGVNYLKKIANKYNSKIRIGGHSKGGNVAVYSAVFCGEEIQKRIVDITNHDGPGFDETIIEKDEYKKVLNKIFTYIPQSSVIGRLLEHKEKYKIVKSIEKGIMQHDIYSWQVIGTKIVQLEEVTNGSEFINDTLRNWLKETSPEDRKEVIDVIYALMQTTKVETFKEFSESKIKNINEVLKNYKNVDQKDKKMITQMAISLGIAAKESIKKRFI